MPSETPSVPVSEDDSLFIQTSRRHMRDRSKLRRDASLPRELPTVVWADGRKYIDVLDLALALHDTVPTVFARIQRALVADPNLRDDIIGLCSPKTEGDPLPKSQLLLGERALDAVLPTKGKLRKIVVDALSNAEDPAAPSTGTNGDDIFITTHEMAKLTGRKYSNISSSINLRVVGKPHLLGSHFFLLRPSADGQTALYGIYATGAAFLLETARGYSEAHKKAVRDRFSELGYEWEYGPQEYPEAVGSKPIAEPETDRAQGATGNAGSRALMVPEKFRRIHTICEAKKGRIGGQDALVVDARDLHAGLEVKTEFAAWLKRRVTENDEFQAGADYEILVAKPDEQDRNKKWGGSNAKVCRLTLETAKRVAMAEGGEVGKLVRSYYLWTEGVVETAGADVVMAVMAGQERMMAIMERVLSRLDAPAAAAPQQILSPPRQGFPGGTESFRDFCSHHPDINVQWFQQLVSDEWRIKKDSITGRWICTERAEQDTPRLLVDIKGAAIINGVDKPYAHLTKPAGTRHYSSVLQDMRKHGPLMDKTNQMKLDIRNKKSGTDEDDLD